MDRQQPESIGRSIKNVLKSDGGFYVSVLILLGYLFTTIQQIVRYAYYGVELTYLLNVKIEDIFLGVYYLITICLLFVLPYELSKYADSRKLIYFKEFIFWVFCCFFSFALTQRFAADFFALFGALIIFFNFMFKKFQPQLEPKIRHWLDSLSQVSKLTLLLICFFVSIIILQFTIESYNKRFTYIQNDSGSFVVLTTFQDNYITIKSDISADTDDIVIFRGNVQLIPIENSALNERQFNHKFFN